MRFAFALLLPLLLSEPCDERCKGTEDPQSPEHFTNPNGPDPTLVIWTTQDFLADGKCVLDESVCQQDSGCAVDVQILIQSTLPAVWVFVPLGYQGGSGATLWERCARGVQMGPYWEFSATLTRTTPVNCGLPMAELIQYFSTDTHDTAYFLGDTELKGTCGPACAEDPV